MKKIITTGLLAALMLVGFVAAAVPAVPNLEAAHTLVLQAIQRIDAAQKANERGDLGGHASKAKDLLMQAEHELHSAAEEANKPDNKKK